MVLFLQTNLKINVQATVKENCTVFHLKRNKNKCLRAINYLAGQEEDILDYIVSIH